MTPEEILSTPAPSPAAGHYLDLLRRCVTREIFDDTGYTITLRGDTWKSKLGRRALGLLARHRLALVRETQTTVDEKLEGHGWPGCAESMSGSRRLEFCQKVLYAIERDGIAGDLFEGGCWRGGAVILMLGALRTFATRDRIVWAADSFEGYPMPSEHGTDDDRWLFEHGAYFRVTPQTLQHNVERYGLMSEAIRILGGYFDESLPVAPIERLALIRIDVDGYAGTRAILEHLYPKLSRGGFLIVDDYLAPGARAAVDGYLAEHSIRDEVRLIPQKKQKGAYLRKSGT